MALRHLWETSRVGIFSPAGKLQTATDNHIFARICTEFGSPVSRCESVVGEDYRRGEPIDSLPDGDSNIDCFRTIAGTDCPDMIYSRLEVGERSFCGTIST